MAIEAEGKTCLYSPRARLSELMLLLVLLSLPLGGCLSAEGYRKQADEVAYQDIAAISKQALGHTEPFTIETPEQTLRRRLLEGQHLQTVGPMSLGTDQLTPLKYWPDDDYLHRPRPAQRDPMPAHPADPLKISLTQALQIGAYNNSGYQTQKEAVFQAALQLDLQIDQFRNTYAGLISSIFGTSGDSDGQTSGVANTGQANLSRRLESGLSLSSSIMVDVAQLVASHQRSSLGIAADMSVTVPLLAGAGKHIVAEPLTQAQRNVLYALWDFELYKKTFAVNIAKSYLGVLAQLNQVTNAKNNYIRLIESVRYTRAMSQQGRLPEIQVNQALQDMLTARNSWISTQLQYEQQLDNFKITLGLPTDARIELEPSELDRLTAAAQKSIGLAPTSERLEGHDYKVVDGKVEVLPPTNEGAGPYELPVQKATALALTHRLDLKIAEDQVLDAQRQVVITADALRPGLNLTADAAAGDRRNSVSSANEPNAQFRPENGSYDVGLTLNLPWHETAQRNAYRNALIGLEQAVRSEHSLEDQVKLEVHNSLRSLRLARESYRIQSRAVQLAQSQVAATKMFLSLGRAQVRDVLDAQTALVTAQNALTSALVNYRVSELQLRTDMGILNVNNQGLWQDNPPPPPTKGTGPGQSPAGKGP